MHVQYLHWIDFTRCHISFIFDADAKFGKESIVETVLRQDCSETDLRTGLPPDLPRFIKLTKYQRNNENTLIAYCDHKNCNTKDFIETSMKKSSQDEWTLIKSRKGNMFYLYCFY